MCNQCHPFYTGKQRLVDSGGRGERFRKRYGQTGKGPTGSTPAAGEPAETLAPAESEDESADAAEA